MIIFKKNKMMTIMKIFTITRNTIIMNTLNVKIYSIMKE